MSAPNIETIVSLSKRRGFVFPAWDITAALARRVSLLPDGLRGGYTKRSIPIGLQHLRIEHPAAFEDVPDLLRVLDIGLGLSQSSDHGIAEHPIADNTIFYRIRPRSPHHDHDLRDGVHVEELPMYALCRESSVPL